MIFFLYSLLKIISVEIITSKAPKRVLIVGTSFQINVQSVQILKLDTLME